MAEKTENGIVSTAITVLDVGAPSVGVLGALFSTHPVPVGIASIWACTPIRQTITRLISGAFAIPETWLLNKKLMLEEKGKSERNIITTFSNEASKTVSENPSLKDRAELYAENIIEKNQKTREDISKKTLKHLSEMESSFENISSPTEDFMRAFESIAEKASSEELQDMMSRILAGEIRKSGSISRSALSIANILDKNIIESMLFIKPYINLASWVCCDALSVSELYPHAELLSSVGITTPLGARQYGFSKDGYALHEYFQGSILISAKDKGLPLSFAPQADGFNITRSGKELFSLLPENKAASIEEIRDSYSKNLFLGEIRIGIKEDGCDKYTYR